MPPGFKTGVREKKGEQNATEMTSQIANAKVGEVVYSR